MKQAVDLKLYSVSTLKPRMTILSEFIFLFQNDVDVTVVDHGQLNIIHVLASVAYVDPDLIKNVIDFYLWLKTSLDVKVLKILLKMGSSQTYNALELSVHLGVFRLATEIFNTEDIYVIIRHVGPFEYRAFDIRVIPCQITQYLGGFPHFVLDFFYMLTISAKICLGNIFQVIASKV